jgi:hypothetical protein
MRRAPSLLAPLAVALLAGCDFFELPELEGGGAVAFVVQPSSGLSTTEAGGTATFTVALATQPDADVRIGVSSSDGAEGTASPAALTFTLRNWDAPQTVTVRGVDDRVVDGPRPYTIVLAPAESGGVYAGADPPDAQIVNQDDDAPGFLFSTTGIATREAGGTANFTVRLASRPTATVTVFLASSRPDEGTVSPETLTFTSGSWDVPQTVTVTGVDDAAVDGDQPYHVVTAPAVSADPAFGGVDPPDVAVTSIDDDVAGIRVTPTSGLVTTEAGGDATFAIRLESRPAFDVTIGLASSRPEEGVVSPASVTFTSENWSTPQTVTVTGVDDEVADGDQPYTVVTAPATSADPAYTGANAPDVAATNEDDDDAGFVLTGTDGPRTDEAGDPALFTVRLSSQPTAPVTIAVASSDPGEGVAQVAALTFSPDNWDVPQAVSVIGVADAVADGDVTYAIVLGPVTSADPAYAGLDPPDVVIVNEDVPAPPLLPTPTPGPGPGPGGPGPG